MGFDDAANRVRTGLGEPQRRSIPVITLAGREYGVSVLSVSPKQPDLSSGEFWDDLYHWPFGPFEWFRHGIRVELVGLDLDVLRVLGAVEGSSRTLDFMELTPQERRDAPIDFDGDAFYGSVFSDGSLLGELRLRRPEAPFEWIEVYL